ncbi:MAG: peptidase M22 [Ruminococcaceae bacterium]|nr:peptidase M22 [Oscillospiraceae bacterium]
MSIFLGIDTSNYTTSVALIDSCSNVISKKRLLPVKKGERGIRQSDAVFHHTKAYPELIKDLFSGVSETPNAIGVSFAPTTEKGSYMPCFLVGESFAEALADVLNIPLFKFSHQQGHIAAALYSVNRLALLQEKFIAFHVSGGTTDAVLCENENDELKITPISSSNDLKAGQAVDRIGVKMGLQFPCGKELEKLALKSEKIYKNKIKLYDGDCSLSGLENKCLKMLESGEAYEDVSKFLLTYIADTLCAMVEEIFRKYGELPLVFAGGVMSNTIIKEIVTSRYSAHFAQPEFSCDNAAGIAVLAKLNFEKSR